MTNPDVLDVLDVFTGIVAPALFTDTRFLDLVICRMVSLSLEHGNSDGSCYAYVWLGMLAGPQFGNYQAGFRFGQLGYDLVEQRGLRRYQVRTYLSFAAFVSPWMRHLKTAGELQRRCFNAANGIGDLTYAAYSCNVLNTNLLAAGEPLAEVQREAETGLEFATNIRFGLVIDYITAQLGLIRTLRGLTAKFGSFDDRRFDELRFERHLASDPVVALPKCWYWIRKMQARFFAGDYSSAIEASLNAERLLWASPAFFETAEYHFYSALSRAASFDTATDDSRQRHVEALVAHQKQHEIWAQHCPENFETRAALVGAEMARLEGHVLEAEQLYEQAIRSAHDNGLVNNEAIAYELAARFYAARGFDKFADTYLLEARYCYQRWGADGKVAQLDHLYPHLRKESPSVPTSAILARTELLDLATVMKVSQAVSGGTVLEPLIDSLMRAAIEHAGADRGLLIRPQGDQLVIEAEAATGGDTVTVHQRDVSANAAVLPESVVRYVMRTRRDVILDDATAENPFSADPYILQCRGRSILCLPLINQANVTGVLYLENNLTSRVFTPDRITVLKVLASQAAISLENSRLYRDLEDRERQYRTVVETATDAVITIDAASRIRLVNPAVTKIFGYEPAELIGRRLTVLMPERLANCHLAGMHSYVETGRRLNASAIESIGLRQNGEEFPVAVSFAESVNDGQHTFTGFIQDLTERHQAEELREARNRLMAVRADVSLALAADNTLTGILQSCVEGIVKHIGAAVARIWVTTKDGRFLELHASAGMDTHLDDADRLVPVGRLNIGRIAQERTLYVTNDAVNDPRLSDSDCSRVEGMVGFAGFPLLAGGQMAGVLAMFSRAPIGEAAMETLGTISDTIAQGIQRKEAEEAVRRSEAFLAEAQVLSQTGSWGWNTATGDLFWSCETYRIFGLTTEVVPTLSMIVDVVHPDDRARFVHEVETFAHDRTDFEHEYRLQLRDGSIKHVYAVGRFAVRGFPNLDCIGAIMDVTERKQAADALLDERVSERTRIARELHDTLLQSFQGLMLRFQSARHLLPEHPAEAGEALDGALDRADQAITEGRDAIQNLRSSTTVSNELAQAITSLAEELTNGADGEKSSATFRTSVEGSPRDLHPIVRDDIHRIAREALRNAFRHAQAAHIEAEVTYGVREVRLRIRDDGKGIDTKHLSAGRARHWGLAGMRERAEQIGARLNLWSKVGAGTEVELRIPGSVAYGAPSGRVGMFRLSSKQGGGA